MVPDALAVWAFNFFTGASGYWVEYDFWLHKDGLDGQLGSVANDPLRQL